MSNICESPFQAGDGSEAVKIVIDTLNAQLRRRKKIKCSTSSQEGLKRGDVEDEGGHLNGSNGPKGSNGSNGSNGSHGTNGYNRFPGITDSSMSDCNGGMVMDKIPDVILLDYIMPIMNGPDATKLMREAGYMGLIIGIM